MIITSFHAFQSFPADYARIVKPGRMKVEVIMATGRMGRPAGFQGAVRAGSVPVLAAGS
jgi:hypothetical protein